MLGLRRGEVFLAEHNESWAVEAAAACLSLREALGDLLIAAEHVGSTAIRSIRAKPIIDIAAGVSDLAPVYDRIDAMRERGFMHKPENDAEWQVFFSSGSSDEDTITHHVHVVLHGGQEWEGYLQFRDFLNSNPETAGEYEALKEELMAKYPFDRPKYTEGKADFIKSVMAAVRDGRIS